MEMRELEMDNKRRRIIGAVNERRAKRNKVQEKRDNAISPSTFLALPSLKKVLREEDAYTITAADARRKHHVATIADLSSSRPPTVESLLRPSSHLY